MSAPPVGIPQRYGTTHELATVTTLQTAELFVTDNGRVFVGIPTDTNNFSGTTINHPLFGYVDAQPLYVDLFSAATEDNRLNVNDNIFAGGTIQTTKLKSATGTIDLNGSKISKTLLQNPQPIGGLWVRVSDNPTAIRRLRSIDYYDDADPQALQYAPSAAETNIIRNVPIGAKILLTPVFIRGENAGPSRFGGFETTYGTVWQNNESLEIDPLTGVLGDSQVRTVRSVNANTDYIIFDNNVAGNEYNVYAAYFIADANLETLGALIETDYISPRSGCKSLYVGPIALEVVDWVQRNQTPLLMPESRYDVRRVYSTYPYRWMGIDRFGFEIIGFDPQISNDLTPFGNNLNEYFDILRRTTIWDQPQNTVFLRFPTRELMKNMSYTQRCRFISQMHVGEHEIQNTPIERNAFDYIPRDSTFRLSRTYSNSLAVGRAVQLLPHQEFLSTHEGEAGYSWNIAPLAGEAADWALVDPTGPFAPRQINDEGLYRNYPRWPQSLSRPTMTIRQTSVFNRNTVLLSLFSRALRNQTDPTINPEIETWNIGRPPEERQPTGAVEAVQAGITNTRLYMAETIDAQDFIFEAGAFGLTNLNDPWLIDAPNFHERQSYIWHTTYKLPTPGFSAGNISDWIGNFKRDYGHINDAMGQVILEIGRVIACCQPGVSKITPRAARFIHLQDDTDNQHPDYIKTRPQPIDGDLTIKDMRVWLHSNDVGDGQTLVIQIRLSHQLLPLDYGTEAKYFHDKSPTGLMIFSMSNNVPTMVLDEVYPGGMPHLNTIASRLATRHLDSGIAISGMGLTEIDRTNSISSPNDRGITMLRLHPFGLLDLWTYENIKLLNGISIGNAPTMPIDSEYGPQRYPYVTLMPLEMAPSDFPSKVYGVEPFTSRWSRLPDTRSLRLYRTENNSETYNNSNGMTNRPVNNTHVIAAGGGLQTCHGDLTYSGFANILVTTVKQVCGGLIVVNLNQTTLTTSRESCAINQVLVAYFTGQTWLPVPDDFDSWHRVLTAVVLPQPGTVPDGTVVRIVKLGLEDVDNTSEEYTALCFGNTNQGFIGLPWVRTFAQDGTYEPLYGPLFDSETPTVDANRVYTMIPLIKNGNVVDLMYSRDINGAPTVEIIGNTDAVPFAVYYRNV
jgi:hypothetical protein